MKKRLRAFVERHPEGWNHDEWLALLAELEQDGTDVAQPADLGLQLEKARLAWELDRRSVKGLGPRRSEALVERFQTLWSLREASVEDVAGVPAIPRALAEKVVAALR